MTGMQWKPDPAAERDIGYGHIVVISARWILIVAAWVLTLWQPEETATSELRLTIVLLMVYSVGNFFLTVQWMRNAESLIRAVYLTCLADLSLITALVIALGGYDSTLFVFYFPALLALSVTLPRAVTTLYTLSVLGAYGAIAAIKAGEIGDTEAQTIATRLILLASIAFAGALYQTIEADRREGKGRMLEMFVGPSDKDRGDGRKPVAAVSARD